MSRPTTPEVVDKLNALGSKDDIALFFKSENVTGVPCRVGWCILANYLGHQTGYATLMDYRPARLEWKAGSLLDSPETMSLTGPLLAFVRAFDHGEYPELVDRTWNLD